MNVPDDPANTAAAPTVTAEGEAFPSAPRRLQFVEMAAPEAGKSVSIAPGLRWARIPLPLDLNHINVWLLETDDGCVVIDTGLAASIGKDAWESIEREYFSQRPLRAVVVTHIHPDHIGLAAWLQERIGVPVVMSRRTYEQANGMWGGEAKSHFSAAEEFFVSHGVTDAMQIRSMFRPERFARMTSGMPRVEQFIADEQTVRWGEGEWTALETNGHAEGHLCFSNPAQRLLISGDQVLPTISSNISFMVGNGDPNPLGSYLSSLQRLRALPEDTLVLPAHGVPFRGLRQRIDDLTGHHLEQLDKVAALCVEPKVAMDLLPFMFRRQLKDMHLFLAIGEALAHLEYLVHAGRVRREVRAGRVTYITLE
ncbi:MBL fold metallo-hydrolase [Steroidobacter sp.]|uniref:MBL fold metallo-hydrolase n=1 Tax=Steroidobacter sp. TaxID=1978227 RepID=UPI001A5A9A2C|nr:MBL fold metallo-hydrolase [Steroidobacter sp.]MBL8269360.1 MBL fold metallo-hydrolase [Steroidobacter sp.]